MNYYRNEAETIPAFLYNAETWTLNKYDKNVIDQAEVYAWKKMIGLPQTTPTAGIFLTVGCLFPSVRVKQKQLLYMHKILKKEETHWTKTTLYALKGHNIGWAKQVMDLLDKWGLEQNWEIIKEKPFREWKREVTAAAEKMNIARIKEECESTSRGDTKIKTKTTFALNTVVSPNYIRKPDLFINSHNSILHTRALIMGRYGMLRCNNNFSNGYGTKMCDNCKDLDTESHRINYCKKWSGINMCNSSEKMDYNDIYSSDIGKCFKVVQMILNLWDLENGKNEIRQNCKES